MIKNKKIILIVLISLVILGFAFIKVSQMRNSLPPPFSSPYVGGKFGMEPKLEVGVKENNITFTNNILGETSVYNFMDKLRSEGKIDFTEKNYIGMGKLIEEINGLKNNNTKNWIYYVNGKKAEIGISNYKIKKDDVVSWKYEENY